MDLVQVKVIIEEEFNPIITSSLDMQRTEVDLNKITKNI